MDAFPTATYKGYDNVAAPFSFLCTLPASGAGIAYHVAVSFADADHPTGVRFTSFVGAGRRAFGILTDEASLEGGIASSGEALCRLAIGQAIRDHLYEKAKEGDAVLDPNATPWDGELKPVGTAPGRARAR
jgi:hypothetical protein